MRPRCSHIVIPTVVSGVATPDKVTHWRCHPYARRNRHKVPKSVLRAGLGRMQFTLHGTRRTPHGASRLVQAMSAWLVKTRRAPSRHSRDARVYGHTTTAMHELSTPPPLPPFLSTRFSLRLPLPPTHPSLSTHFYLYTFSFVSLCYVCCSCRHIPKMLLPRLLLASGLSKSCVNVTLSRLDYLGHTADNAGK